MKRFRVLPLFLTLALVPACRAENPYSFGAILRQFTQALHRPPEHPQLLATFAFFGRLMHPREGSGFHLAVFEVSHRLPLDTVAGQVLAPAWSRMVVSEDRRDGDQSLIYIHPDRERFQMLIVNQDGGDHEVSLVALEVNPKQLMHEADAHAHP